MKDIQTDLDNMKNNSEYEGDDRFTRLTVTANIIENIILNLEPDHIVEMFEPIGFIDETNVHDCIVDCIETVKLHDSVEDDEDYQNNEIVTRSRVMLINIAIYLTGLDPADTDTETNTGVIH